METAHSMLTPSDASRRARPLSRALLSLALLPLIGAACAQRTLQLTEPATLSAPYADRDVIWAVAPLVNESGVSIVDELSVTDALVNAITEVEGLTAQPTNRTLGALRAMGLPEVRTPDEARALARALGADAVVVGTITDWYPYDPLRFGLNLVVYARTDAMSLAEVDPVALSQARTDSQIGAGNTGGDLPLAGVARHYDTSNHAVVAQVRRYAEGRHDPRSALGNDIYLKSMERFTQFVCFRTVELLLDRERERLALAEAQVTQ
jgi:hypothetical protein